MAEENADREDSESKNSSHKAITKSHATQNTNNIHAACVKYLRKIDNEPWFYNLQGNLQKIKDAQPRAEFVFSHFRYRGLARNQSALADQESLNDCANFILDIESYPTLKQFKRLPLAQRVAQFENRLKQLKIVNQPVMKSSCMTFLGGLKTPTEFNKFKKIMAQKQRSGEVEQFIYDQIVAETSNQDTTFDFSVRDCLLLSRKVHTFEHLGQFIQSTPTATEIAH